MIRHITTNRKRTVILENYFDLPGPPSPGWEVRIDEGRNPRGRKPCAMRPSTMELTQCKQTMEQIMEESIA